MTVNYVNFLIFWANSNFDYEIPVIIIIIKTAGFETSD